MKGRTKRGTGIYRGQGIQKFGIIFPPLRSGAKQLGGDPLTVAWWAQCALLVPIFLEN